MRSAGTGLSSKNISRFDGIYFGSFICFVGWSASGRDEREAVCGTAGQASPVSAAVGRLASLPI